VSVADPWERAAAIDAEFNEVSRELGLPDVVFPTQWTRPRLPRRTLTTERRAAIARLVRQHAATRVVPWLLGEDCEERHGFRVDKNVRVYFLESAGLVKIGMTTGMDYRLKSLRTMSAVPIDYLTSTPGSYGIERALHLHFAEHRSHGEWFRPNEPLVNLIEVLAQLEKEERAEEAVA
jgi:hypothetical protein